jgi:hypothetical protein
MERAQKRLGVVVVAAAVLSGCSAALQSRLGEGPPEHVGYLSHEGFVPCDAASGTARWRPIFAGPAARQEEHLRSTGLLSLPRPLLVRVAGRVSTNLPNHNYIGYTHSISVTDILGMWLSGDCDSADADFRPIAQAHARGERGG